MRQPEPAVSSDTSSEASYIREAAFARIVADHARFLYRVAHSLLRHRQDAEDAVQEALLKLYRGDAWRRMEDERAFLARVVWRTALDRMKARGDGGSVALDDAADERQMQDARPTPETSAAAGEQRALLHELIDALPVELREPLLLSAMEELSSREVGLAMGLPEGTVRTRLMRARLELRAGFESRRLKQPVDSGPWIASARRRR